MSCTKYSADPDSLSRRRWLAAVSAGVMMAGCQWRAPLRLGFIGGLSGRFADLGGGGRNGAMLAVEQRNAAGGVAGHPIELIVTDDAHDAAQAGRAFAALIEADVQAVVGPMTSAMAMVLVPLSNAAGCLLMGGTVVTEQLSGLDDFFLRTISTTRDYARRAAEYHHDTLGLHHAALFADTANASYTEDWINDYSRTFLKLGGEIRSRTLFDSNRPPDFTQIVAASAVSTAQIGVIVASPVDTAALAGALRKAFPAISLAGSGWSATERLIELGSTAVEGMLVEQYFDRDDKTPDFVRFRQQYAQRFGEDAGYAAITTYDATNVLLAGLAHASKGLDLKQAILKQRDFKVLQGTIRFNANGDVHRPTWLTRIANGRFVAVARLDSGSQ